MRIRTRSVSTAALALALSGCGSAANGNNAADSGPAGTSSPDASTGGNDGGPTGTTNPDAGSTDAAGPAAPVPDSGPIPSCEAGVPQAPDGGAPVGMTKAGPGGYPAAHLDFAKMIYGGDRLLYHPKIVTITFPGETQATAYESLGDSITSSGWWDAVTDGYCDQCGNCIGHGVGAGHIHLTKAPAASYTDSAKPGDPSTLKDLIKGYVADGTFPEPDNDTLYVIYFPQGVTLTQPNGTATATSCQQFAGYHMHVPVTLKDGSTVDAAYAILPNCGVLGALQGPWSVDASHEIIEATTDPLVTDSTANGFYIDQSRLAWAQAGEVGDACALLQVFSSNPLQNPGPWDYVETGTTVQKIWNNKSLLAGNDPCVPAASGVYFNVAPSVEQLVMKTGDTKTISLTGFSSAATSDWNVAAKDLTATTTGGAAILGLTLDKATANNGTTLNLTIKVNGTVDPTAGAGFVIVSSDTAGAHLAYWLGIVTAQ